MNKYLVRVLGYDMPLNEGLRRLAIGISCIVSIITMYANKDTYGVLTIGLGVFTFVACQAVLIFLFIALQWIKDGFNTTGNE